MITPAYEQKHVRWDEFGRFHVIHAREHGGITAVEFTESKEVLVMASGLSVDPAARRAYPRLGLEVWRVTDPDLTQRFTLRTPDGTVVKGAWLTEGDPRQLVLVDTTCNRAVLLSDGRKMAASPDSRPASLARWGGVYYNTASGMPLPPGPLTYGPPRDLSTAERGHLRDIQAAAAAWKTLHADEIQYMGDSQVQLREGSPLLETWEPSAPHSGYGKRNATLRAFYSRLGLPVSRLLGQAFGDLSTCEIATVAHRGIHYDRQDQTVPFLTV